MNATRPKVAFLSTGGTIASVGANSLQILDYGSNGKMLQAEEIVAAVPELALVAEVIPVRFSTVPSSNLYFSDWQLMVTECDRLVAAHPDLAGIVIGHGTGSLEETAYFLNLTLKVPVPVVLVGSQRPISALSSDAGMNLLNAVRVAASPDSRGLGVLVLLNDEINAARDVTNTSNLRLQTFRTADFGALGHADGDAVVYYRRPVRLAAPQTEFDIRGLASLPRVDIAPSYTGADGTAIRAYVAAGAAGIICAGFAPGSPTPADFEALEQAAAAGVVVMQCTRAGSGRVFQGKRLQQAGFLTTDNLTPVKARLLLALALTQTRDPAEITRMFLTY